LRAKGSKTQLGTGSYSARVEQLFFLAAAMTSFLAEVNLE